MYIPFNGMVSSRAKVYKVRTLACPNCCPDYQYAKEKPWIAIHLAGNRRFNTWREAYDYARTPLYTLT